MSLQGSCCEAERGVEAEEVRDEGGCDELGSRLEEELNRSIEKMREEEAETGGTPVTREAEVPLARLISLSDSVFSSESPSGSTSLHSGSGLCHSPLELLQDVEIPTCNISCCELTSQSNTSTTSPQHDSMGAGQQALSETSTQNCLETAVLVMTSSSHSINTSLSDSVYNKEHTGSPHSFFELLQDVEMPTYNMSSCEPSKLFSLLLTSTTNNDSHHPVHDGSGDPKTSPTAASMESRGEGAASHSHRRATLKDQEAVDVDNTNTGLLTLSPIKKLHSKETPSPAPPSQNSPEDLEMSKQGSDTLSSSGILGEALLVLTELEKVAVNLTSSPQSPDRRLTVHPLDMEGINDSLLSSSLPHAHQKPLPQISQDCSLPSATMKEGDDVAQHHKVVKKEDTMERMTKLLGITSDQSIFSDDKSVALNPASAAGLENTNCASTIAEQHANQTFSANGHTLKEGNPAVNITFAFKKALPRDASPATNTTFDFNKVPPGNGNPAANSTFDLKLAAVKENPSTNTAFDCNKVPTVTGNSDANTTFDCNRVPVVKENPSANTTFDFNRLPAGKGNPDVNTTFDCNKPPQGGNPAAGITFNNKTAEGKDHPVAANTTFDCNKDKEGDMVVNTTFTAIQNQPSSQADDKDTELNVTFEKGEYRIGSQNETVNLMDAEENILQVILDATPKKVSKQPPKASSTPKISGNLQQPHLKAGLIKASPMNFLNRLLEGAKREGQQEPSAATITTDPPAALKFVEAAVRSSQQQQRRQHGMRPGPLKALPLSMVVTNAAHLEATAGGESSGGSNSSTKGTLAQRRRITVPSFGSISSIESEMPSTPDCGINRNTSISSPEAFRVDVLSCAPCITSTPTFTGRGVYTAMMEMDGAIPTPISQASCKPHFSQLMSSSSLPEGMSSGSLDKEGMCQKFSRDETKPKSLPDQPPPANMGTATQSPSPSPLKSLQVEDSGNKQSKDCEEQQKPPICSNASQTTVPPSPQPSLPLTPPRTRPSSPLTQTSLPLLTPPLPTQPSSLPPPTPTTQPSLPLPPPSPTQPPPPTTQPSSLPPPPPTTQPSSLPPPSPTTQPPSLPPPPTAQPSSLPPPSPTTQPPSLPPSPATQPSSPLLPPPPTAQPPLPPLPPTQPSSPPPTQPQMSLPPPTKASAPQIPSGGVATTAQPLPLSTPLPHVSKENVSLTKPQKGALVLSSSRKSLPAASGTAVKKDAKLKRPSSLHKPATHKVKQVQPPNSITNKENKRINSVAESRQNPPPPPQTKTERPSPLLSKRNPSPRLVLKPSNTNTKPVINKFKVSKSILASKSAPVKNDQQVETVGAASAKDKCIPRKPLPQSKSVLPRSPSGSKLPKNLNTSDSNLPSLKITQSYSKKPPSPGINHAPEAARKSGLTSVSGRTLPVTDLPGKPSSAPQIKATLPVRNSVALRRKPSLLKTPKPVL